MYTVGAVAITDATIVRGFGVATGPVLIDEVRCVGNETRLTNCYHNGVGTHDCDHSEDVGVLCQIRKPQMCGVTFSNFGKYILYMQGLRTWNLYMLLKNRSHDIFLHCSSHS